MQAFDDIIRDDSSPKRRRESSYDFLNRSARPEFDDVRQRIDRWLHRYPARHRTELVARIRDQSDSEHSAAIFELAVHQLLLSLGARVQVHPDSAHTSKRVDFQATFPDGVVMVEATETNGAIRRGDPGPIEQELLDAIDKLPSPNFFLQVETYGRLERAPERRRVLDPIRELLAAHDPDSVIASFERSGPAGAPSTVVSIEDWSLHVQLIAKSPSHRGIATDPTVGIESTSWGWGDGSESLRDAVLSKAKAYGEQGRPFMVAVNAYNIHSSNEESRALYDRGQSSVWFRHATPRYSRLSGVLVFRGLRPWSLGETSHRLYLNPHATHPVPLSFRTLPIAWIAPDEDPHLSESDARLDTLLS